MEAKLQIARECGHEDQTGGTESSPVADATRDRSGTSRVTLQFPSRRVPQLRLADGILETIGQTPLVRLRRYLDRPDVELWAKLEMANPGGSAKDRPATRMLEEARRRGVVRETTLIVESSSGNTGIGLAQYCRYHGLRFCCVVDPRIQPQNLAILEALGTEVVMVEEPDPRSGDFLVARLKKVREILVATPDSFWPDQYTNGDNPRSHEEGTMKEIDEVLDGRLDYLFVATSSTGTLGGCETFLRRKGRVTRIVAVDAEGSVLFGGEAGARKIPGLGSGSLPPLARRVGEHQVVRVSDLESVIGCRRLVAREAILAGGSSGAVLEAIRRCAPSLPSGAVCAAILPDRGTRYLDTVFNDAWVEEQLDCSPEALAAAVAGVPEPTPGQSQAAGGCA